MSRFSFRTQFLWFLCGVFATAICGFVFLRDRAEKPAAKPVSIKAAGGFGPAIGPSPGGRVPGEFEHQDALLLGVNELLDLHPQTLVDIIKAIDGRLQIVALIGRSEQESKARRLLEAHHVATHNLHFFLWPAVSMWVQDFGPQQLVNGDVRIIDFEYQHTGREAENQLPMAFAATFGMKIAHCHLALEGGNYLSNGQGLCISSAALIEQNRVRNYDLNAVATVLKNEFRFKQWSYLMPIIGEETGHLDMFLTITDPSTVVLASYDPAQDQGNAERMDANAKTLQSVVLEGRPLRILRIKSPPQRDGIWRTYTNVIFANGVLLVPQYPDYSPVLDRLAIETYQQALPNWKIVGINASSIIHQRGSLHCISLNLPSMPNLTASE
jgi:agmatine/peptidylarginine deiminase